MPRPLETAGSSPGGAGRTPRPAQDDGQARALYADLMATAARHGTPLICCEVNVDPPNPASDAFHETLGFSEVGRAFLPDRGKVVRYLERRI